MWVAVARIILRNRITILIILGLITIFMAYKAKDVQMSYEYAQLLPSDDPANKDHIYFKEIFGEEANVIAIGIQDSSFFTLEKFMAWRKLCNKIKEIDGVNEVLSIAQLLNLEKNNKSKRFITQQIFHDSISSQTELDSLKDLALSLPFYKGYIYNAETHVYLMGISLDKEMLDTKERDFLIEEIIVLADEFSADQSVKLYFSGLPYIRTAVTKMVKSEIIMFIFLAMMVCVIILYIFFRSFKVVFFSMLVVGVGVIWVMGTMVLLNFKITMLTGMIPPLLIVIGIPNSIFLLNKYHQEYKKHGNKILALQRVIRKIGNAIFLTNLTTASGFATFIITSSEVLQEFGIIASINIMGVFFLALFLIPIIFSFLNPPKEKHIKHLDNKLVGGFINSLVHYTINHRRVIYISTILILLIGFWGISRIKTTGFMVDDIPKDNPIYTDLKFFEKEMNGVMPLEILIDTKKPNGVFRLSTLRKIEKLQNKLAKYPELSKPISFIEVAKFSRQAFYNGNVEKYTLPLDDQEKTWILNYVKSDDDKNDNLVHSYLDSLRQITRISVNVHDIGTTRMADLTDSIQAEIDTIFSPAKLNLKATDNQEFNTILTGTSYIFFKGTSYLIRNLFVSLTLAILLIAVFMSLMFKSARMVIVSLIPNIIPLILTAGMMGILGIPIKPSTVLVFSIAFGISVDDTIHFLAKYRQEIITTNWDIGRSVNNAIRETGISMMYSSIVLFFGFGIFVASSFGGTMALGLLVSFTLLVAMFANLVLLPALLLSLEKSIIMKAFKEPLIEIFDEEEDIELDNLVIMKDSPPEENNS